MTATQLLTLAIALLLAGGFVLAAFLWYVKHHRVHEKKKVAPDIIEVLGPRGIEPAVRNKSGVTRIYGENDLNPDPDDPPSNLRK
ncbi:MAG: hypothetical protein AAB601_00485 [Patescibacteria group bacterium]